MRDHLPCTTMPIIRKTVTSAGENVEKLESLHTKGTVQWCNHEEKSLAIS